MAVQCLGGRSLGDRFLEGVAKLGSSRGQKVTSVFSLSDYTLIECKKPLRFKCPDRHLTFYSHCSHLQSTRHCIDITSLHGHHQRICYIAPVTDFCTHAHSVLTDSHAWSQHIINYGCPTKAFHLNHGKINFKNVCVCVLGICVYHSPSYFYKRFIYIYVYICMYVCVCIHKCVCCTCAHIHSVALLEARRGRQMLQAWSYRRLWARHGCWELNFSLECS